MFIFLWQRVPRLTNRHHGGGGITVVAHTLEEALQLIDVEQALNHSSEFDEPREKARVPVKAPDFMAKLVDDACTPECWFFPDAGCC